MNENSVFETKLKLDFNLNVDLSDVKFINSNIKKYNGNSENVFGEKLCLFYTADFIIYNVPFSMKILALSYEKSSEILKLDIDVTNKHIEKEMASCRNYLQRQRNLNSAFATLIQFAKFVETRRLICSIVLSKEPKIVFSKYADGGLYIKFLDKLINIIICVGWKIEWSLKDSAIVDVIEVYYNNFNLPNANDIKQKLTTMTHPSLDFHMKLKLWKLLMDDLKKFSTNTVQAVITIRETKSVSEAESVLVISDNEEENKNGEAPKNKRRKLELRGCPSSVVFVVPD